MTGGRCYIPTMTLLHSGKVRDVYADGEDLILVASDRVSVYDVVLPTPIPDKGAVLTRLSLWWFEQLADVVDNHVISATDVPDEWRGRAIRCRRLDMVPVECIARGYLTGLGLHGVPEDRPGGRRGAAGRAASRRTACPEPIFTPTTKAPVGEHDEFITYADVVDQEGARTAEDLRRITLAGVPSGAPTSPGPRGIIIADTKVEIGRAADGTLVLADEVLTPDSSRFWGLDDVGAGPRAVLVRQADRPRLGHRHRLGQDPARPGDPAETSSRPPARATSRCTNDSPATTGSGRRVYAVTIASPGGPDVLTWSEVDDPVPGDGEVLIDVVAAGINRADLLQRAGFYPPPPGAPPYPGMECSGRVAAVGRGVTRLAPSGDEVCALHRRRRVRAEGRGPGRALPARTVGSGPGRRGRPARGRLHGVEQRLRAGPAAEPGHVAGARRRQRHRHLRHPARRGAGGAGADHRPGDEAPDPARSRRRGGDRLHRPTTS